MNKRVTLTKTEADFLLSATLREYNSVTSFTPGKDLAKAGLDALIRKLEGVIKNG